MERRLCEILRTFDPARQTRRRTRSSHILLTMRIDVREHRRLAGRVEVDPAARPTKIAAGSDREVYLNWDGALDDAGRLRKCVVCGCGDLFQEKAFPQITGIVIVLAFAGAAAGVFGFVTNIPVLAAMTVVLAIDVGILVFSKKRLVCYRCRTSYRDLPIARYHRRWERAVAERHATPLAAHRETAGRPALQLAGAARTGGA